jgi:hypothetical protein
MAAKRRRNHKKGNLILPVGSASVRLQPDVMAAGHLVDCVDVVRLKPDPHEEASAPGPKRMAAKRRRNRKSGNLTLPVGSA